jgi:hypothetical protein
MFAEPELNELSLALDEDLSEDGGLEELFRLAGPASFEQAVSAGLSRLADAETAMQNATSQQHDVLRPLRRALDELSGITREIRALRLPRSSVEAFLQGAGRAASPTTTAGMGAVAGAAIGTMILPGVGSAIGGALGAMAGGYHEDQRNSELLDRWDQQITAVWRACFECFDQAWDRIPGAPLSSLFTQAEEGWSSLLEDEPDDINAFLPMIDAFLEEQGPLPSALRLTIQYLNSMEHIDGYRYAQQLMTVEDWRPGSIELAADAALVAGNAEQALRWTERILTEHPHHLGLQLTQIEASAALGRVDAAWKAARALQQQRDDWSGYRHALRGVVRRDQPRSGHKLLKEWVAGQGEPAVVQVLNKDTLLSAAFQDGRLGVKASPVKMMRSAVQDVLDTNSHRFSTIPSGERGSNMRSWIGQRVGELLWCHDWSFWGNGKGGLAITSTHVIWKISFGEPVRIKLSTVDPEQVSVDIEAFEILQVGDNIVDTGDVDLTAALSQLLPRLIQYSSTSRGR